MRRRSMLLGVLTVLMCGYLLGPQLQSLGPNGFRLDLAAVGLRVVEWDRDKEKLLGFGVADLHEPVSAEEYVGIATILLALATVALAVQTRLLASDSKRQLVHVASQANALRESVKLSAAMVDELRSAEIRRSIVELRQHLHTVNVAAIELSSAIAVARRLKSESQGSAVALTTVDSSAQKVIDDVKQVCQALYPRLMALVDDLPFVSNELREDANHAVVTLMFISSPTVEGVRDAELGWGKARIGLLNAMDAFQGRPRTWKEADDILATPEGGSG